MHVNFNLKTVIQNERKEKGTTYMFHTLTKGIPFLDGGASHFNSKIDFGCSPQKGNGCWLCSQKKHWHGGKGES